MSFFRWCLPLLLLAPMASAAEPKVPAGFAGVRPDGFALLTVNVAQLWDEPLLKPMRDALPKTKNAFTNSWEKEGGLKVELVERVTLYWPDAPAVGNSGEPFKIVATRKPCDRAALIKTLKLKTAEELGDTPEGREATGIAGKNVYFTNGTAVIFADDRTIVYTPFLMGNSESVTGVLKVLAGTAEKVVDRPLAEALAAAEKHTLVASADFSPIRKLLEGVGFIPDAYQPFKPLIGAERGLLTFDFGPKIRATAKLTFFDAEAAKIAEPAAKKLVAFAIASLKEFRKEKDSEPEAQAASDAIFDFAIGSLGRVEPKLDGKVVTATATGELDAAMKKVLAEGPAHVSAAADRMSTSNNAKQIALAVHNFESANGHLPGDIADGDGKAILSWRVQLLPYLEHENIYKQLDLTKPWDDAANKQLLEEMPAVFGFPSREDPKKGFTYFQTFTAPKELESGNPFLVPGQKRTFAKIADGTSNTLMIVDGEAAVNWLKPGDLPYDPKLLPKIGDPKTGKFLAAMGDGSVRWFDLKKIGEKKLHALITIDGGEVVDLDK